MLQINNNNGLGKCCGCVSGGNVVFERKECLWHDENDVVVLDKVHGFF